MRDNWWVLALVGAAAGLGLFYLFSREMPTPPTQATTTPAVEQASAAAATPDRAGEVPVHMMVPAIDAHRIAEQTRRAPRPLLQTPPPSARPGTLPGAPGGPPVDISSRHPLPAGMQLTPAIDAQGRFHLSLAPGWAAAPPADPNAGPALLLTPPASAPAGLHAAIYTSRLPPVEPDAFFKAVVGAVSVRGEKLLSAQRVKDGAQVGYEIITEVSGPAGRQVQRSLYLWRGQDTVQLLTRAPHAAYAAWAPQFYAMGRTLGLGR